MGNYYKNFFLLEQGWATKYLWFKWALKVEEGQGKFEEDIKKGCAIFDRYSGTIPGDIANSTSATILYSENMVSLLEKESCNLRKWPIKIILSEKSKKKIKQLIPNYYYIEPIKYVQDITGFSGKGEIALFLNEKGKFTTAGRNGLYFNLKEVGGSNFFGIAGTQLIVVTRKLKEIIEKTKLKNVQFVNVEDYKW